MIKIEDMPENFPADKRETAEHIVNVLFKERKSISAKILCGDTNEPMLSIFCAGVVTYELREILKFCNENDISVYISGSHYQTDVTFYLYK